MTVVRTWSIRAIVVALSLLALVAGATVSGAQSASAATAFTFEEVSSEDGPLCEGTFLFNSANVLKNSEVTIEIFDGENAEFLGDFQLPDEAVSEESKAWVDLPAGLVLLEATAVDESGNITLLAEYETYIPSCDEDGHENDGSWVYETPGHHFVYSDESGSWREWFTTCEPYSQTYRCTTDILADTVIYQNGVFIALKKQRVFNNLTYLPLMERSQWVGNPLAYDGEWTAEDGREWRTECDTAATGRGGCRSYAMASVIETDLDEDGNRVYRVVKKEVFNNIVSFALAA